MLDWHSCQICYPLEIKLLLLYYKANNPNQTAIEDVLHLPLYTLYTRVLSKVDELR